MNRTTIRAAGMSASVFFILCIFLASAAGQQTSLQIDPAKTSVHFTLGASLHTVHGSFQAKVSVLQFDPASSHISGSILVDAKSGQTGNGMRDRKMHKDVLESETYPEISFRPDRVEGAVAAQGRSSVKVHGTFHIHGTDHEVEVPVDVDMGPETWSATVHFNIPYAKWGMKNPSTLFLRASEAVEIELVLAGPSQPTTATPQTQ